MIPHGKRVAYVHVHPVQRVYKVGFNTFIGDSF